MQTLSWLWARPPRLLIPGLIQGFLFPLPAVLVGLLGMLVHADRFLGELLGLAIFGPPFVSVVVVAACELRHRSLWRASWLLIGNAAGIGVLNLSIFGLLAMFV